MSVEKKTHRLVKKPQMSARYLADYMAASETAKRTIVQRCKYQSTARVIQHDDAKLEVSKYIQGGGGSTTAMLEAAQKIRDRLASDEFERDLFDSNADYIEQFAAICGTLNLPKTADRLPPGRPITIELNGVAVRPQIQFRLRRVARGNKLKTGAAMLRYAKGKLLAGETAAWQSAFLFGCLHATEAGEDGAEPEQTLCLTIDAHGGIAHPAPSDAIRRFQNMKAACASIAERWPNVPPPPKAVL